MRVISRLKQAYRAAVLMNLTNEIQRMLLVLVGPSASVAVLWDKITLGRRSMTIDQISANLAARHVGGCTKLGGQKRRHCHLALVRFLFRVGF